MRIVAQMVAHLLTGFDGGLLLLVHGFDPGVHGGCVLPACLLGLDGVSSGLARARAWILVERVHVRRLLRARRTSDARRVRMYDAAVPWPLRAARHPSPARASRRRTGVTAA